MKVYNLEDVTKKVVAQVKFLYQEKEHILNFCEASMYTLQKVNYEQGQNNLNYANSLIYECLDKTSLETLTALDIKEDGKMLNNQSKLATLFKVKKDEHLLGIYEDIFGNKQEVDTKKK